MENTAALGPPQCCNIVIYVASKHHESCYIVHMLRHSTIQVARTGCVAPKHHKAAPQAACTLQQVIRPLLGHRDAACLLFVDDDASNTDDVAAGAAVARAPECVVCMPCAGARMHVSHVHARVVLREFVRAGVWARTRVLPVGVSA